jgi:hypothetical protein
MKKLIIAVNVRFNSPKLYRRFTLGLSFLHGSIDRQVRSTQKKVK